LLADLLPDDWPLPPATFLYVWFVFVFVLGAGVGSFLNVCIYRLAYEKSILWPLGSYCGHCFQPIRWYDNLPLVSYWLLRGHCRKCKAQFSSRYFVIELLTAVAFVGLFYLDVVLNVHKLDALKPENLRLENQIQMGLIPFEGWVIFCFHATLVSLLIIASFIDLDHMEIPLSLTATGTVIGLIAGAVLFPYLPAQAIQRGPAAVPMMFRAANLDLKSGLYPWPVWYELPAWMPPTSWLAGLATGLAGMAVGMFMLRGVRFVFGVGRGLEGLGVGDADLMMMAGAFIGWQPVVVAFFMGVFPALLFGIYHLISRGNQELPFGPSLAIGIVVTLLGWQWIAARLGSLPFELPVIVFLGSAAVVFLFIAALFLRIARRRGEET
jgi:leader peptidase (prepilin peptidase)/N-methyltransferase